MRSIIPLAIVIAASTCAPAGGQAEFESDTFATNGPDLEITFIGHGTLMFTWGEVVVHVDPVSRYGDYSVLPKADLILITHDHGDHWDRDLCRELTKETTTLIYPPACGEQSGQYVNMANGESRRDFDIGIEAVPAYNIEHLRDNGQPYHPEGRGNGYILTFGDTRVYVAGDTENTPEMKALDDIDIAFLPMNLPYTMTPEMVADAARAFRPAILYPYHFGDTDPEELVDLLGGEADIEVRVRDLR
jgi:L-ascorbate metabolism protein UlaG (beta-lactamase superfamily)